jgi:hypothetical protein
LEADVKKIHCRERFRKSNVTGYQVQSKNAARIKVGGGRSLGMYPTGIEYTHNGEKVWVQQGQPLMPKKE